MTKTFEPARSDGRSDRRVVFDLACDAEPETLFEHDLIIKALSDGLDEPVDLGRVYRAVGSANQLLLRERRRYLHIVRGTGYRVLNAEEHLPVALQRKDRAQNHLRRGIELLKNARLDELTQAQRVLHEGQLMILSGVFQAVEDSHRRHDRAEGLIADLIRGNREIVGRLEHLEHLESGKREDQPS